MNYKNPVPTVDIIIELENNGATDIVLIDRKNPPFVYLAPLVCAWDVWVWISR